MVMHWNTVSMAKKKLSKLVMPPLGPSHRPRHSVPLIRHWRPDQSEGPQDPEGSQRFHIQTSRFSRHVMSRRHLAGLMSHRLQDDAEQPARTEHLN
ncbi:hypothetical protein EYF80_033171 [Liparis tanakae]|uniref:Uncharacterized protein n=1 Tax=Liparis tanakae TaxID=230148 RepID=A0A4Z2GVP7_9TELE|nr:hypothetical protein EYF80_033171 [Liparis tanakae]